MSDSASDSAVHEPASSTPPSAGGQRKDPRIGKRKPCPDLNTIEDVQERRKQRRLAKNRATAAVSRCWLETLQYLPWHLLFSRLSGSTKNIGCLHRIT